MRFDILTQDREKLKASLIEAGAVFISDKAFKCPAHGDRRASAGIFSDPSGHWRYKCQACGWGGDIADLYKYIGKSVDEGERAVSKRPQGKTHLTGKELESFFRSLGEIEKVHKYHTAKGELAFCMARIKTKEGKTIRPFMRRGSKYTLGLPPAPRVLYNLPQVVKAHTVVVVEGEKCSDVLSKYGFTSATSVGGAKNARHSDWAPLAGKNVIFWPDNDPDGRQYIKDIEKILSGLEPKPQISVISPAELELTGTGEDAADFVEQCKIAGLDAKQELQAAISKARPQGPAANLLKQADLIEQGLYRAVGFPWRLLTTMTQALTPQTVTVLCGNPGATKTLCLLQALKFWQSRGIKAVCLELEWDKEYHLKRALAQESNNSNVTNL